MPTHFTVTCPDDQARTVKELSRRYGITQDEVLQQLVTLGLESLEEQPL